MTSLYNLMMGYLVSYIFFILVVQYQDYKNKIHVSTVIKPPLESIVTSIREVNSVFSQASGKQGFNGLSESQNKEVMSSINSNDIVERVPETFLFGASSWATIKNLCSEILKNYSHIFRILNLS
ncbi:hypothetical protein CGK45_23020 [Vibrio parahaemolyticus]|nr:hypothetical protein CGK45_23020 [Vibrio parahaemolyticus]